MVVRDVLGAVRPRCILAVSFVHPQVGSRTPRATPASPPVMRRDWVLQLSRQTVDDQFVEL